MEITEILMPLDLTKTEADTAAVSAVMPAWLASPDRFQDFILAFHSFKLPAAEFNHAGHVAVAAHIAVRDLGHRRDLFREYYSWDVVADRDARRAWVAPDLIGPFGPIS